MISNSIYMTFTKQSKMTKKYLVKTKLIPCSETLITNTFNEVGRMGYLFETSIACGTNPQYLYLVFSKEE